MNSLTQSQIMRLDLITDDLASAANSLYQLEGELEGEDREFIRELKARLWGVINDMGDTWRLT